MSIFPKELLTDLLNIHSEFEKRANDMDKAGFTKQAFDTRRINSETQINPRRNLQNYQRSEPFITDEVSNKIKILFKVKNAADQIKEQFIGDPDWLDSNSRILCNAVDNTLRLEQKDYDFFKPQFDYLDELLYLRYRLASEDIERLNEEEIKNVLLRKDEKLMYKSVYSNYQPKRINEANYPLQPMLISTGNREVEDSLTEKLFGNVKANKDNKSVERSINIIIKDSILDDSQKLNNTKDEEAKNREK